MEVEFILMVIQIGLTSGSFVSLGPAATVEISPRDKVGARLGASLLLGCVGSIVGSPIAGAIVHDISDETIRNCIFFTVSWPFFLITFFLGFLMFITVTGRSVCPCRYFQSCRSLETIHKIERQGLTGQ